MVHLGSVSKPVFLFLLLIPGRDSSPEVSCRDVKKSFKGDGKVAYCSHNVTDSIIFISLYDKYFPVKNCNI